MYSLLVSKAIALNVVGIGVVTDPYFLVSVRSDHMIST